MREIDKIAEDLFDKIRSRFENVSVGDATAKATNDPSKARFFNFSYVSRDGADFGNITVSLVDETSLKIYFTKNITHELDDEQRAEWFEFLRNMRFFAKRNLLSFDTRDISKSNLKLRDLQHVSDADSTLSVNDVGVNESRMFGNTKHSYQTIGPVRLVVKHSATIDEAVAGARTRNIDAIFVETQLGERFLLPVKKLNPARALARHIGNGGIVQDDIGNHIVNVVKEMQDMTVFVRNMRNRTFEDAETVNMVEAAADRYHELKTNLIAISGQRGYSEFKESFKLSDAIMEDDFDIDALKERFVKKVFDDRLSEALPHVYRAYRAKQTAMENSYVAEFDNWATNLAEGTWSLPDNDAAVHSLTDIMAKPIRVGPRGNDAIAALTDIIGSDELYNEFYEMSESDGPDSDVRPLIIEWLANNNFSDLAAEFESAQQATDSTQPNPGQLTPQANVATPESPVPVNQPVPGVMPARESIGEMKRLAGLI